MSRVLFADRLQELRRVAGLTREQLARRAGVSPQALSKMELGAQNPSWDVVCRLADALLVNVAVQLVVDHTPIDLAVWSLEETVKGHRIHPDELSHRGPSEVVQVSGLQAPDRTGGQTAIGDAGFVTGRARARQASCR